MREIQRFYHMVASDLSFFGSGLLIFVCPHKPSAYIYYYMLTVHKEPVIQCSSSEYGYFARAQN